MKFDDQEESENEIIFSIKKYVGPSLVVLIVSMVVYYVFVIHLFGTSNHTPANAPSPGSTMADCGLFGDMFGAFSAFFGGLGFIAVAITTVIQMQQAHRTQVETTFFNMLTRLGQIIENSYYPDTDDKGQVYLKKAMEALWRTYNSATINALVELARQELPPDSSNKQQADFITNTKLPKDKCKQLVIDSYEKFYTVHEHNLGHYFRYLYNIIKYVRKNFKDKPKVAQEFIALIQAQMSNDELGLLFYNAISIHGQNLKGENVFRCWLDDYDFFENIDSTRIFDEVFLEFYPMTHFKFKIREQLLKGA